MRKFNSRYRFSSLSLLILIIAAGCATPLIPQTGAMTTENHSIDLGTATSAHVQIMMDMGELTINSGEGQLMEGTFNYNVTNWQPKVSYRIEGDQGSLLINQPDANNRLIYKDAQNNWDLRFSDAVPIDLEIKTGAGNSELNLSGIDLTHLSVETGAGNGVIDLSSVRSHDLFVAIKGGVGNVSVLLPRAMGVQVTVKTGIGGVETSGLTQNGNVYTNEAFGESSETLYLDIESGIGAVDLQLR